MPLLPAIIHNSEVTVPANVHLLCRSVCFQRTPDNTDVLYVTEKVTQTVGCSACSLAARAPYLVLSLFFVLIRDPPLPVVAVRHFVRAHKLDTAKVFRSLGDDARHLGWHKQVHLKEGGKKKEEICFSWLSRLEIPALQTWMRGEKPCLLYLVHNSTPDYPCPVNDPYLYKHCNMAQRIYKIT